MKKRVYLSLICASILSANEITTPTVSVNETVTSEVVSNVSSEDIKSADLAEALSKNLPSVSLIRRSGIANDILLRGQKRDNINVTIDGAKIYGACPNRMDPPTSHVLSNNVENVVVSEGPFDVENFGTLSGIVKVETKKPKKGVQGDINFNMGSFDYRKGSATVSGGNDFVRALVSVSTESSDQYEDGNGDTLYEQQRRQDVDNSRVYKDEYKDMEAYEKSTLLTKLYFNLTDNQEINFSYTANRSDDVLYANSGMDALYDDSDIYTVGYKAVDLGAFSKELNIDYYYSKVDHPMATTYRNNGAMEMTNHMNSKMRGFKVKNSTEISESLLTYGIDLSKRTWEGEYYSKMNPYMGDSIPSTDTKNKALFAKFETQFGDLSVTTGVRYDDTEIETAGDQDDNDYDGFSGYIMSTYEANDTTKYFSGVGKSMRVPDARELYFLTSAGGVTGTPDLDETKNYEIDLGFEKVIGNFTIKTKAFYSKLKDYIYLNTSNASNKFENIDAKIYGLDISGAYYATDEISIDYGVAYQRGKKDEAFDGQSDTDLADITPLKANLAFNYEYDKSKFSAEVIAAKSWSNYDEDNGEQALGGYGILNLKYNRELSKHFDITLGVDNVLDKTYAVSNTYADLTLISAGTTEAMLLNEPGRYAYFNLKFKF